MKPDEAWKNFALGHELSVSGAFLFDGIRRFHEMQNFDHTDQIFGFFYNLSVGFERLFKVAIVLLEHDNCQNQGEFEQSLITHNHPELLGRIAKSADPGLHKRHIEFLYLLSLFYKTFRYDRFMLPKENDWSMEKEKTALRKYLEKHLSMKIESDYPIFSTQNSVQCRRFVGKIVQQVSRALYNIIVNRARTLNLYTYELRNESKAQKMFMGTTDFVSEDILWKELLIFFMNTQKESGLLRFMRSIKPLDFDAELAEEYLMCFQSEELKASVLDELEIHYEELRDRKMRINYMDAIANPNVYFEDDDDDEDSE